MSSPPAPTRLISRLVAVAGPGTPVVLSDTSASGGELVLRVGDVVVKAHPEGTDRDALAARLRLAASPALREVLVPPLGPDQLIVQVADRLVTRWPVGQPVCPDQPDHAPWEPAARLLARIHTSPVPPEAPPTEAPARVAGAVRRLLARPHRDPAARVVLRAYRTLPPWAAGLAGPAPADRVTLVHGDWHLGQLVRLGEQWRLIDLDTLGVGDPRWDLARPAAWFAAGLLDPAVWHRFLTAYRAAGGVAIPPGDPWPVLDLPARALLVQSAATVLAKTDRQISDPLDQVLIDCCARIASSAPPDPDGDRPAVGTLGA